MSKRKVHFDDEHQPTKFQKTTADITRNAFVRWWRTIYLKSPKGKKMMKAARKQLNILLTIRSARSADRSLLHSGVRRAIETWELFPPTEGSDEYRMARIRLLADLLWSGEYSIRRVWGERLVCFTPQDLSDARQWLYKGPGGRIARYQSLEHVWQRKDLI